MSFQAVYSIPNTDFIFDKSFYSFIQAVQTVNTISYAQCYFPSAGTENSLHVAKFPSLGTENTAIFRPQFWLRSRSGPVLETSHFAT